MSIRFKNITYYLSILTIFFCLSFPKAGFYIEDIPINFGLILLGLTNFLIWCEFIGDLIIKKRIKFHVLSFFYLIIILAFYFLLVFFINGYSNNKIFFSIIISIFFIPIMTLGIMRYIIKKKTTHLAKVFYISFLIVTLFGIASFILINFFHIAIGVPYLTVTGGDPNIVFLKNNVRDFVVKAVSTYNNGNLLGVNILIWFPLIMYYFYPSFKNKILGRILFLLTFSRTVFIGWFLLEALVFLKKYSFLTKLFLSFWFFLILIMSLFIVGQQYGWFGFLTDSTLGGRISQFDILTNFQLFPDEPVQGIQEVVYLSVLKNFGLVGLILFLITYFSPLFISSKNYFQMICKNSVLVYLLIMFSDGAFVLFPTQFIFWMLVSLLYYGNKYESKEVKLAYDK